MQRLMGSADRTWFLLQCKPRQDARALEHLERQGFHCFSPTLRTETRRKGVTVENRQPLFPGYVFVRFAAHDNWTAMRSTRGVTRVVSFNGQACPVAESVIELIQTRSAQSDITRQFKAGDTVHIKSGPFADMEAIFLSTDGDERVVLLLSLLSRQQSIRLPLANLSA